MTIVIQELREQITATQESLTAAIEADQPYDAARHRARLEDLIEMAERHGIDLRDVVDRTLLNG